MFVRRIENRLSHLSESVNMLGRIFRNKGGEENNGMCPCYLRCLARKAFTWMIESAAAAGLYWN